MVKSDLIRELKTSPESVLSILQKGYLFHFPMDEEIYQVLLNRLTTDANLAGTILEKGAKDDPSVSTDDVEAANKTLEEIRGVVFNTCLSQVHREPYVSKAILTIQKKINSKFISKVQDKLNEGYTFIQDPFTQNFKILNKFNQCVSETPFTPISTILNQWGVDSKDPQFFLFFAAIFPREDLTNFKQSYAFSQFFSF